MSKISVILPAYNASKYIKESISSILNQTFADFELIIIDDGSTDSTQDIITSFRDSRIKNIQVKKNRGIVRSLNYGLYISQAPIIARMDADDISLPNRLEEQYSYLKENKDIDILSSAVFTKQKGKMGGVLYDSHITLLLLFFNPIAHPTVMLRKDNLQSMKLYYDKNATHCEDYKLWIDCKINNFKFHKLDDIHLNYNFDNERISYKYRDMQIQSFAEYAYQYNLVFFKEIIGGHKNAFISFLRERCVPEEVQVIFALCNRLKEYNKKYRLFDPEAYDSIIDMKLRSVEII